MDSIHQIWHAVMQLTTAELLRLRLYAQWRMNGIGRKALGRDGTDLLNEAIIVTATGEQPWKTGIDLCSHLVDAMRTISFEWDEIGIEEYLESELTWEDGTSPFDRPGVSDPEKMLVAKETVDQVKQLCSEDPVESQVVELLAQELTPLEIQEQIPISQRRYRSAIRQIRLGMQKEFAETLLASSNKFPRRVVAPPLRTRSNLRHGDDHKE